MARVINVIKETVQKIVGYETRIHLTVEDFESLSREVNQDEFGAMSQFIVLEIHRKIMEELQS